MAYGKLELKIETVNVATRLVEMHGEHFEPKVADRGKEPSLKVNSPFSGSDNRA